MFRAMIYKELRETWRIAALALVAYLYIAANSIGIFEKIMNWNETFQIVDSNFQGPPDIPFVTTDFYDKFSLATFVFLAALGFWQATSESRRNAWLFLLHHPTTKKKLIVSKLFSGITLAIFCIPVPILIYGAWAATPGTHPSPFEWGMTVCCWKNAYNLSPLYFAAFLTGIRPAWWFGSRLFPLAVAVSFEIVINREFSFAPAFDLAIVTMVNLAYVFCILNVAQTRDFS